MVRYLMFMSYIGTRYRGAAKQIGCERMIDIDSVQGALETAFHTLRPRSKIKPEIQLSSRTDAGVHACCSAAQVNLENPYDVFYDPEITVAKINGYFARCGHEIRLMNLYPISDNFNCRKNALSRTYIYRIIVAKQANEHRVPIAENGRSWHVRGENINIDAAKSATKLFLGGKKNFETFAGRNRTNRVINYVKEIKKLSIEPALPLMPDDPFADKFNYWQVTVNSRSFVYNQVRRIVGALVGVAYGSLTERDVKLMLQIPNHANWNTHAMMAPPQGLYLKQVEYDIDELNSHIIKGEQLEIIRQKILKDNEELALANN